MHILGNLEKGEFEKNILDKVSFLYHVKNSLKR